MIEDFSGYRTFIRAGHLHSSVGGALPARDEAIKPLEGKTRFELLPVDALNEIAEVLTYGAAIRGENNWTKGQHWSRYIGAALRHIFAYYRGENFDPETQKSHLAHAACCILFLLAYQLRGIGTDDRQTTQTKGV
jgi:hypothetical protein